MRVGIVTALACARFSPLPGIVISRGIFPRYFRAQHDAISPFRQESTPFRLEFGNSRANFRAIRHSPPGTQLPSAIAPFRRPRPPFPRLPAMTASLLARLPSPGRTLSRPPAGTGLRARDGEPWEVTGRIHQHGPGARVNVPGRISAAPFTIVLLTTSVFSLGVHGKVYSRRVLHVPRQKGVPLLIGTRIGTRISWQRGTGTGSRTWPNGLPALRTVPGSRPGNPACGPPRQQQAVPPRTGASGCRPRAARPVAGEPIPVCCHAFAVPVEPPPAPRRCRQGGGRAPGWPGRNSLIYRNPVFGASFHLRPGIRCHRGRVGRLLREFDVPGSYLSWTFRVPPVYPRAAFPPVLAVARRWAANRRNLHARRGLEDRGAPSGAGVLTSCCAWHGRSARAGRAVRPSAGARTARAPGVYLAR
jgi:hypothetical protein